jgi:hypothetical protein
MGSFLFIGDLNVRCSLEGGDCVVCDEFGAQAEAANFGGVTGAGEAGPDGFGG